MRVIAGKARRLTLSTPEGMDTRPTKDRIRETLFNILQDNIPQAIFVDLFSGSGAIGIEALSRGASKSYFIDNNKEAINCITKNLKSTKLDAGGVVLKQDAIDALYAIKEEHVDIFYIDPPYQKNLEKDVLKALVNFNYVDQDTLLIVEADEKTSFDEIEDWGYCIEREKIYKANKLIFIRKQRS